MTTASHPPSECCESCKAIFLTLWFGKRSRTTSLAQAAYLRQAAKTIERALLVFRVGTLTGCEHLPASAPEASIRTHPITHLPDAPISIKPIYLNPNFYARIFLKKSSGIPLQMSHPSCHASDVMNTKISSHNPAFTSSTKPASLRASLTPMPLTHQTPLLP